MNLGGVIATLSDVGAFFSALLTGRVFEEPATLDTMLAVRPGFMDGYGLGIFRVNTGGRRGFGHSGFWGVFVVHYPSEELMLALWSTSSRRAAPCSASWAPRSARCWARVGRPGDGGRATRVRATRVRDTASMTARPLL